MSENHEVRITDEQWRELDAEHVAWELDGGRPVIVRAADAQEWGAAPMAQVKITESDYMPIMAMVTMPQGAMRVEDMATMREVLRVAEGITHQANERIKVAQREFEQQTGQPA